MLSTVMVHIVDRFFAQVGSKDWMVYFTNHEGLCEFGRSQRKESWAYTVLRL